MINEHIVNFINREEDNALRISHAIFDRPELGNEEWYAQELLSDYLELHDFTVKRHIAGHPTGFIASYDSKKPGPEIAFLAEYDALPDLGHACGHNIIGVSSVLGAAALRSVIDEIGGRIKVFGSPAEEGGVNGSAKATYAKNGLFDHSDVALMVHPGRESYRTVPTLAVDVFEVEFFGRSAHASETSMYGINALDMMINFFNGVAQLRQHIKPKEKVHGIILNGGASANIIPGYTKARFYTRALSRRELNILTDKVERIASGAALISGGQHKLTHIQNGVNEFILNDRLDDLFERHAKLHDEIIQHDDFGFGSTDTGNVSHIIPTIHPHIKIGPSDLVGHTPEFAEAARSEMGDRALTQGAKIMATMAVELITNKEVLSEIKALHERLKEKINEHIHT